MRAPKTSLTSPHGKLRAVVLVFLKSGRHFRTEDSYEPLLRKVYLHTNFAYQFRDSVAWLKLTILDSLRNSGPHWSDPLQLDITDPCEMPALKGT